MVIFWRFSAADASFSTIDDVADVGGAVRCDAAASSISIKTTDNEYINSIPDRSAAAATAAVYDTDDDDIDDVSKYSSVADVVSAAIDDDTNGLVNFLALLQMLLLMVLYMVLYMFCCCWYFCCS